MYKAKIQLRPNNQNLYSYVINELKNNKIDIVKQTKLKEGIDIYINSSTFAFGLAKKARKEFKLETKVTRSLYGLNKERGNKLYRLTVLLRMQ